MPTINKIWDKYKFTRESGDYIDQERFIEAVAEIISLPVEAQVSQENGEHPLHTFRAKDGRFKYTSLASRKIHNDIVYTLANRLEQFVSEHIRTETQ